MSDRVDPGPGWRLLEEGERKPGGYQSLSVDGFWWNGSCVGEVFCQAESVPCRVRVYREGTTKAIATRATVRSVFAGGIATESTIRSDVGLSLNQMEKATEAYEKRLFDLRNKSAMPEYIMLEIQRGENDF